MKPLYLGLLAALSVATAAACGADDERAGAGNDDGNANGGGNANGSPDDPADDDAQGEPGQGSGSGQGDAGAGSGRDASQMRPPSNGCAEHVVSASKAIPDMLVVLDRSASMAPDGNPMKTDRWTGSVSAVVDVTRSFDDRVHFGLMTFPGAQATGRRGDTNACAPGMLNVDIGADKGDAIATSLMGMGPGGYTPTAATLQQAAKVIGMSNFSDQTVIAPKYVLLVTDGDPNCSSGTAGPTTADPVARQQTIDAIKALSSAGVQTFVVGYQTGASSFAQTLDQMAAAGATGQTKHRSVESGADLMMVFEDIAARAVSCSYKLGAPVSDPTYVKVSVDNKARGFQNSADGWTLGPDKQTVTLTGAACDAVRAGAKFSVQVVCEPQFVQ